MQKLDALLKRRREVGGAVVEAQAAIREAKNRDHACLLAIDNIRPCIVIPKDVFIQLAEDTLASLEKELEELDATIDAIETLIK